MLPNVGLFYFQKSFNLIAEKSSCSLAQHILILLFMINRWKFETKTLYVDSISKVFINIICFLHDGQIGRINIILKNRVEANNTFYCRKIEHMQLLRRNSIQQKIKRCPCYKILAPILRIANENILIFLYQSLITL